MTTNSYKHFMLDIETFGIAPNSVISAIAIVQFDNEGPIEGTERLWYPSIKEQQEKGRTIDSDCLLDFWFAPEQDKARKDIFEGHLTRSAHVDNVITALQKEMHIAPDSGLITPILWAKPTTFDVVILADLFRDFDRTPPWHYRNTRCLNTVMAALPDTPRLERLDIHTALGDAIAQAKELTNALQDASSSVSKYNPKECSKSATASAEGS